MIKPVSLLILIVCLSGCFPKKAGRHLAHFHSEAPIVGEAAPSFALKTVNGDTVELSELLGDKPIVLQLGSHTCPVYRYRRFSMSKLYREYSDSAHFLLVYTLEAHPKGAINPYVDREWVSSFNYLTNTIVGEHQDFAERQSMAAYSTQKLNVAYPVVVDSMNNAIWRAYGRAPSAAFVIDKTGHIALRQAWINPSEIAATLDHLIDSESSEETFNEP